MYDVNYFLDKLSAIPEHKWIECRLFDDNGNCCVNGHCGVRSKSEEDKYGSRPDSFIHTEESIALNKIIKDAYMVNDGSDDKYKQPTPKQRILAVLYDIKAMQEKDNPELNRVDITKDLAVLPVEETADTINQPVFN